MSDVARHSAATASIGALPARFRRRRVGIIGHGDVGARILNEQAVPGGARLIAVSRSLGWNLDAPIDCRRLARSVQEWIVLVPPAEHGGNLDSRSQLLVQAIAWAKAQRRRCSYASAVMPRGPAASIGPAMFTDEFNRFRGVYISTTGVYGDHRGAVVHETSACRTTQPRSLRRLDAERHWRGLGAHVLRVPGITARDRLPIQRIRDGLPALRSEDDVYTNHIEANDLARICWVALWRGRPSRVTNTVMKSQLKMGDYMDAVADAAGLARVPRIDRAGFEALVKEGRISPMMASFMRDSRRVTSDRLRKELRFQPRFDSIEDLIATLREASQNN